AMIRLRAEAASTSDSPPLQLPSASHREDRPEVTLPPWKKLAGGLRADCGFVATMDREIMRDPEREVGYGITDSWDEIVEALQGVPVSTDTELGGYMREFEMREIYMRLDDEQSKRQLLAGRLNMLFRDRRDSPTGTGDSLAGTGYRIIGTAGTRWRSYTARATRGGWWQFID
nr:hypothetical protein [Tanacetum cinerariifolium]